MARVLLLIDNNNPFPSNLENTLSGRGYDVQTYDLTNQLDFSSEPLYDADICVVSLPASPNTLLVSGWMFAKETKVVAYAPNKRASNELNNVLEGIAYSSLELIGLIKNILIKSMKPIDLGLSVLWADRNLGAQCVDDFGYYVRWSRNRIRILEDHNGNRVSIPRGWRVPTEDELYELIKKCKIEDVHSNHETKVVGQNGELIIFKYGGFYDLKEDYAPDKTNNCGFFLSAPSGCLYLGYDIFRRHMYWVRNNREWNDKSFINVRLVKDR